MNNFKKSIFGVALLSITISLGGCKDSESYSDLLRDEEKAVNWFMAQQEVLLDIPEDGNFEVGEDAPYYKMDEDGHVYMQVISKGDMDDRPEKGDKVYFRFSREDLKTLYETGETSSYGNADNLNSGLGSTYFFYGNTTYPSTTQYGTGIQLPMDYFGYYSEVNLILRSYQGFTTDQSQCIPYKYTVQYYKAEY